MACLDSFKSKYIKDKLPTSERQQEALIKAMVEKEAPDKKKEEKEAETQEGRAKEEKGHETSKSKEKRSEDSKEREKMRLPPKKLILKIKTDGTENPESASDPQSDLKQKGQKHSESDTGHHGEETKSKEKTETEKKTRLTKEEKEEKEYKKSEGRETKETSKKDKGGEGKERKHKEKEEKEKEKKTHGRVHKRKRRENAFDASIDAYIKRRMDEKHAKRERTPSPSTSGDESDEASSSAAPALPTKKPSGAGIEHASVGASDIAVTNVTTSVGNDSVSSLASTLTATSSPNAAVTTPAVVDVTFSASIVTVSTSSVSVGATTAVVAVSSDAAIVNTTTATATTATIVSSIVATDMPVSGASETACNVDGSDTGSATAGVTTISVEPSDCNANLTVAIASSDSSVIASDTLLASSPKNVISHVTTTASTDVIAEASAADCTSAETAKVMAASSVVTASIPSAPVTTAVSSLINGTLPVDVTTSPTPPLAPTSSSPPQSTATSLPSLLSSVEPVASNVVDTDGSPVSRKSDISPMDIATRSAVTAVTDSPVVTTVTSTAVYSADTADTANSVTDATSIGSFDAPMLGSPVASLSSTDVTNNATVTDAGHSGVPSVGNVIGDSSSPSASITGATVRRLSNADEEDEAKRKRRKEEHLNVPKSVSRRGSASHVKDEQIDNEVGSPEPKVPPLKIVIPQQAETEPGNKNGKSNSSRHGGLPYVVVSNDDTSTQASCTNSIAAVTAADNSGSAGDEIRAQARTLRSTGSTSQVETVALSAMPSTSASAVPGPSSASVIEGTTEIQQQPPAPQPGSSTGTSVPEEQMHPKKRRMRAAYESAELEVPPLTVPPQPHELPVNNNYSIYLGIRKQLEKKKRMLFPVQPKPPQGFKDYLMNKCTYILAHNADERVKKRLSSPPEGVHPKMRPFFMKQEEERFNLKMRHLVEKEKLVLSVEQEILRVHGRAARALANQALPFSVISVLKDEEVYNLVGLDEEEKDKNARSRYNGRLFISWLQDVDDKWERIKEDMLQRHNLEADSLQSKQKIEWSFKLFEYGLYMGIDLPKIEEAHVPQISVDVLY